MSHRAVSIYPGWIWMFLIRIMPEYGPADDLGSARDTKAGHLEDLRTKPPDSDVRHPLRAAEGLVVAIAVSIMMWLILAWVIWKWL